MYKYKQKRKSTFAQSLSVGNGGNAVRRKCQRNKLQEVSPSTKISFLKVAVKIRNGSSLHRQAASSYLYDGGRDTCSSAGSSALVYLFTVSSEPKKNGSWKKNI